MKEEPKVETHESYGMLGVSRSTGGDGVLFGSHIRHQHQVRIRIRRASVTRDLHQDWVHGDQHELIEVVMSPTQWAEAITSMNLGDGVPCTITHVAGKRMGRPPVKSERAAIQDEFKAHMEKVGRKLKAGLEMVEALLAKKGGTTKGDLREVYDAWRKLRQELDSDAPFIHKQFDEAMDATVAEAKGEVEAFVQHAIMRAGMQAIGESLAAPKLLEDRSDGQA